MKTITFFLGLITSSFLLTAQTNLGLQVEEGMTVLFGADTNGSGVKAFWLPSKGAFRIGGVGNVHGFTSDQTIWDPDSIGMFSFATGFGTKAIGDYSMAIGARNQARGDYSVVMGLYNKASGNYSTATGRETDALG